MVPFIEDTTKYRLITNNHVKTIEVSGREILEVDPEGISVLTATGFSDTSHLLRTHHLVQLRKILDDPEASDNDRFVALDLLKNAKRLSSENKRLHAKIENVKEQNGSLRVFDADMQSALTNRTATLYALSDCDGTPIAPSTSNAVATKPTSLKSP